MKDFARQEAVGFAEWKFTNKWFQRPDNAKFLQIDSSNIGHKTTEQLYELYIKEKEDK